MKTATLVQLIKEYNDAYRRGEPLISDEEYDLLVEELKTKDPQNKLLKKRSLRRLNHLIEWRDFLFQCIVLKNSKKSMN